MAPTVYPNDRDDAKALARRLLEAAGPGRHDQVQTITDGPAGVAFDVPDDVYRFVVTGRAAGALSGDADGEPGTALDRPDIGAPESTELVDGRDDDDGEPSPPAEGTADTGQEPAASAPARQRRRTR
ncbi:MAG TPA: hypothetical protein VF755_21255 [Catenuloplanes sp.]|jgi:hypothetical protein